MTMGRANIRSHLRQRRRSCDPMAEYDRLPGPLRCWLAEAALPWSPRSALRIWRKALRSSGGDVEHARGHLAQAEMRQLRRDTVSLYGADHPAA